MRFSASFVLTLAVANPLGAQSATFTPLGDLPGGKYDSSANDTSEDGRVVVGLSWIENDYRSYEGYRWTTDEGMVRMGDFDNDGLFDWVGAAKISADGLVIVGRGEKDGVGQVYRWTADTGMEILDATLSGGFLNVGSAADITRDGQVVVGTGSTADSTEAYRWDSTSGYVRLGSLGGLSWDDKPRSEATGVSADGSVVVGSSTIAGHPDNEEAFRWTAETGMVGLGHLPNDDTLISQVRAISADGETIVGRCYVNGYDQKAFRWTESEGMVNLNIGTRENRPHAVSGDGRIILGLMWDKEIGDGPVDFRGFIWTEETGARELRQVLVDDYGLGEELEGWSISASGISNDGTKIIGSGTNPDGNGEAFIIDLAPQEPPEIATSPIAATVDTTGSTSLSVEATGNELQYQWQLDGVDVPDATEMTYAIPSAQRFHAGDYTAIVSNGAGSVSSASATVTVEPPPTSDARLTNLSTRAMALTGNNVLIPGFVISGAGSKALLIRAVGATLRQEPFNIPTALEDPKMTLRRRNGSAFEDLASNDDWETNTNAAEIAQATATLGAFALTDGKDAAVYVELEAGVYTVVAGGVGDLTGVAIVELYDADGDTATSVLTNISNRGFVGTGASIMIPGITVSSEGPKTFLIRAVGPALGVDPFNLPSVLEDPKLTVFSGQDPILFNDNWGDNPDSAHTAQISAQLGAFPLPDGSKDAAFVVTLPPGNYTILAAGVDGATGTAIVEVYVVE